MVSLTTTLTSNLLQCPYFQNQRRITLVGEDAGQGPARLNEVGAWDLLRPDRRDLNPKSERLLCPAGFSLIEPTDPSLLVNKTRLINILKILTLKAATEKI